MFVSASIGKLSALPATLLKTACAMPTRQCITPSPTAKARFEFFSDGLARAGHYRFETETGLRKAMTRINWWFIISRLSAGQSLHLRL